MLQFKAAKLISEVLDMYSEIIRKRTNDHVTKMILTLKHKKYI